MKREGWNTVTPRLIVDDPARAVAFLVDAFAAEGELRTGQPSILRIGDSNVMISDGFSDDRQIRVHEPTKSLLYVYVDDVDATYTRAIAAGASSVEEPENMPWGDRRATVADPFGNDWQISAYLG